jgi:DNA invertase Pin-like site-specific DNA recombinase
MKAVAYARYSSNKQREESVDAQLRAIREYAEKEGHEIIQVYKDEAVTGTKDNREQFLQMLDDSKQRIFELVLVHKFDRFARNKYDSAVYKKILRDNGARVVSILEPLDDSPESVVIESLWESMAEYYSKNLAREVKKGKKENALKGWHNGGMPQYGYKVNKVTKKYEIVPEEAAIVKEIFAKVANGCSIGYVERWLKEQGIKTRAGVYFSRKTLNRILDQEKYLGWYVYNRYVDQSRWANAKKDKKIIVKDAYEAIVDEETFNRVQAIIVPHKKGPMPRATKYAEYFLTGYVYCGYCGSHMYGYRCNKNYCRKDGTLVKYSQPFYTCARKSSESRHRDKRCDESKGIKKDELEQFVLESIKRNIFSDDGISLISEQIAKAFASGKNAKSGDIESFGKELAKCKSQQSRLLDAYMDNLVDKATYAERNTDLVNKINYYTDKLERAKGDYKVLTDLGRIKDSLVNLRDKEEDSIEYKRLLLSTFIDKIEVTKETVKIYYKFDLFSCHDFACKRTTVSTCVHLYTEISPADLYAMDMEKATMTLL